MPITKPITPNRSQIQPQDVKIWIKRWNVQPDALEKAIEKAGNSIAAVRKELVIQGLLKPEIDTADES